MNKLTKQALKRLQEAPVEVRLYNGCFNVASVKAEFSRYSVELRVEVTNPVLAWQCGNKNKVKLVYWKSCSGEPLELPSELDVLVEKLRSAGTMSDEQARNLSRKNASVFAEVANQLGF